MTLCLIGRMWDTDMVCESTSIFNTNIHCTCAVESDGNLTAHANLVHNGSNVGFFGATPTTKPSALTTANSGTVDLLYGTAERDVIINMRTRIAELESKLQSLGLLS